MQESTVAAPKGTARPGGRAAPLPVEQRRAAIIAAAIPLITRDGAAVSTKSIAEAAGIAEGTLFRAFQDKDTLIRAVVESVFDPAPTFAALSGIDRDAPYPDRMTAVVDILRERLAQVWTLLGALRMLGPPEPQSGRRWTQPKLSDESMNAVIREILEPPSGFLRFDAEYVTRVLQMFVFAGTNQRITNGHPMETADIVSILLDGVRAHSP
ncbi:TetR/AcrR family transcriptional regulator [Nakamurella alba]|uniref:TetR/AcrR family transcriptional regulator n=1 Tax=Nakamurella alba TaxID=2665158 RepID=UPI001E35610A|nr:TetR/AcrR family transcriptional regulator [Nakamurella alba]